VVKTVADSSCDTCTYFVFDEDYDGYVCLADMDEDDYIRFQGLKDKGCPFYRLDDEYKIVRRQN
jgi:hypothetical protein